MEYAVKVEQNWLRKACSAYFFFTIALVGLCTAYCFAFPLYVLARLIPALFPLADRVLNFGVHLLMSIQPWVHADIEIQLPPPPHPKGLLMVGNHRSHLDAFYILARVPGVRMLANRSLFFNPFIGPMLWAMGHIPAEKSLASFWAAMEKVRSRLERGEIVFIFPELSRCPPGFSGVQEFVSLPFRVAADLGTPIVPLAISGTDRAWPKGDLRLRPGQSVQIRTLAVIHPTAGTSAGDLRRLAFTAIDQQVLP